MYLTPYSCPVVTGRVMAEIDRVSIEERGTPGLRLMERAGEGAARRLMTSLDPSRLFRSAIVCGKGNNGGDGFVVARLLHKEGFQPVAALMGSRDDLKGDARTACERMCESGVPLTECRDERGVEDYFSQTENSPVAIDALLGTGAHGAPRGLVGLAARKLSQRAHRRFTAALDVCSGVEADTGRVEGDAVWADVVYTMGLPKVGHALPPGVDYYNRLEILDIGFPRDLLEGAGSEAEWLRPQMIDAWLPRRGVSTHKVSEGHLLVIAGSRGMTGAALMCAKAALRAGAGLITAACPASLLPVYAGGLWEMMTLPCDETETGALSESAFDAIAAGLDRFSAIAIGPGLGRHPSTQALVQRVVDEVDKPLLIDGDGLFALSLDRLTSRTAPWTITPHPGEAGRLLGVSSREVQSGRWASARRLAAGAGAAVLKGPKSVIAGPEGKLYVNPTGNSAMASGGMGDALSGLIGALLAKGIPAARAAASGAFIHGLAADRLVERTGAEALSAGQVIEEIPLAIREIRQSGQSALGA
ncbi:MAG: NAD(P)H-hydrate dehydratase [bacterium]|nr:NAD(P)H-hydrate dehydratase [bacterium]